MTEERPLRNDASFWAVVVAGVLLLALSISNDSLWIDEGFVAWVVDHRTPLDIAHSLTPQIMPSPADRQYPLYDLWMWLWTRAFGASEYALRAANLPFGALYVVAVALAGRSGFRHRYAWFPFVFAPFVWFYMNEARPYLMLVAFSTAALAALTVYGFGSPLASARARSLVFPAFFFALATHILAVLLLPGAFIIYWRSRQAKRSKPLPSLYKPLLQWAIPLIALTAFYGATLAGSDTGREVDNNQNRGGPVALYAGEILYEQAGFAGLGPARNALRTRNALDGFRTNLPWLAFGALGIGVVILLGVRTADWDRTRTFALAWAVSFGLAFVASEAIGARFLGRHLSAVFPLLLLVGLSFVRDRAQAVLLFAIFATSDVRLALLHDYWRDDYRGAVADVIQRQRDGGGSIDWAGDDLTANYYGLSLANSRQELQPPIVWPITARGVDAVDRSAAFDESLVRRQLQSGAPVYLALGKPDVFDTLGGWEATVQKLGGVKVAEYRTFTIYRFGAEPKAIR